MASFATQVQIRRGTEAENNAFTGAEGEVTMDLTNKQLRVHDGQTKGGMKIPNIETVFGTNQIANNAVTEEKIADNAVTGGKIADGAVSLGKLGNNSVNTSKIVNGSITPEKMVGQPTFTGNAGKTLAVNQAGNGFEFIESTLPENSDYVIESQEPTEANGYTWYRLYKSGWVEQGGKQYITVPGNSQTVRTVISLPIEMNNANYNTQLTQEQIKGAVTLAVAKRYEGATQDPSTQTTLSIISINNKDGDYTTPVNYMWQVSGMSAQGSN